jgi:hypothetical protein
VRGAKVIRARVRRKLPKHGDDMSLDVA